MLSSSPLASPLPTAAHDHFGVDAGNETLVEPTIATTVPSLSSPLSAVPQPDHATHPSLHMSSSLASLSSSSSSSSFNTHSLLADPNDWVCHNGCTPHVIQPSCLQCSHLARCAAESEHEHDREGRIEVANEHTKHARDLCNKQQIRRGAQDFKVGDLILFFPHFKIVTKVHDRTALAIVVQCNSTRTMSKIVFSYNKTVTTTLPSYDRHMTVA